MWLLLSLGTRVSDYSHLRVCPAVFPPWISCWLNLEPHLHVIGNRICSVMLHYPCWSKDIPVEPEMGTFPVFSRKKMERGVCIQASQNLGRWEVLRTSSSLCLVMVSELLTGKGPLRTAGTRGSYAIELLQGTSQNHMCINLQADKWYLLHVCTGIFSNACRCHHD